MKSLAVTDGLTCCGRFFAIILASPITSTVVVTGSIAMGKYRAGCAGKLASKPFVLAEVFVGASAGRVATDVATVIFEI